MCDINEGLLQENDILKDEIVDLYRKETKEYRTMIDIFCKRLFILVILSLTVVITVVITMCVENYKLQRSYIKFLDQYEFTNDITTQAYTITQDNKNGNNNNVIGNGDNTIKGSDK